MRERIPFCTPPSKYRHFPLFPVKCCLYAEDFRGTQKSGYLTTSLQSKTVAVLVARASPLPRSFRALGSGVNEKACTPNACCHVATLVLPGAVKLVVEVTWIVALPALVPLLALFRWAVPSPASLVSSCSPAWRVWATSPLQPPWHPISERASCFFLVLTSQCFVQILNAWDQGFEILIQEKAQSASVEPFLSRLGACGGSRKVSTAGFLGVGWGWGGVWLLTDGVGESCWDEITHDLAKVTPKGHCP